VFESYPATGDYEEKEAYYSRYDVVIDVNTDGSINITEVMEIVYVSGTFTYAYRDIPYYGYDDIIDVKVYELVNGELVEYRVGHSAPKTYMVRKSLTSVYIKWWYPQVRTSEGRVIKTFILSYKVTCAIDVDDRREINYLYWYVLPEEHLFIRSSVIKIRLPSNIDLSRLVVSPNPVNITRLEDGRVEVKYVLENLYESDTLKVYVGFPKIIEVPFSLRKTLNRYAFLLIILTVVVSLFSVGLYAINERSKYSVKDSSIIVTVTAPTEIDAAEACVLAKLNMPKILPLVILFQLAEKGFIKFKKTKRKTRIEIQKWDREDIESLKPWEREIFSRLVREGMTPNLRSVLRNMEISPDWNAARTEAYSSIVDSLISKGLIPGDPSEIWRPAVKRTLWFVIIPVFLMVLGYLSLIYAIFITGVSSLFMVMLSAYLVKKISVHRTRSGELVYQRAKYYVRELEKRLNNIMSLGQLNTVSRELRDIFTYGFTWLLALESLSVFKILENIWKELKRRYKRSEMPYWYPHWFSSTSSRNINSIHSIKLFINSFKPALTIVARSIPLSSASGGIGGFSGGIGGAGGGGSAGVG